MYHFGKRSSRQHTKVGREYLDFLISQKSLVKVAKIIKPVSISPAVLFDLKVLRQSSGSRISRFDSCMVKWREKKKIPDVKITIWII